jgi:putative ABC transport system permease protein
VPRSRRPRGDRPSPGTTLVSSVLEAAGELRVHKLRVLLSLIGVAVAVASLASIVAIADLGRAQMQEQNERWGGRPATLQVNATPTGAAALDTTRLEGLVQQAADRHGITHIARSFAGLQVPVQLPTGVSRVMASAVDVDYGIMHRVPIAEGRWFVGADQDRLAPAVILSEPLWEQLGSPSLAAHPTVQLAGENAGTHVVVGVTAKQGEWDTEQAVTLLYEQFTPPADVAASGITPLLELWVPESDAEALRVQLQSDLAVGLSDQVDVSVNRSDYAGMQQGDPMAVFTIITGAIAVVVLLLGVLSLVNIALVSMRQRIREIGVRRSFGATQGRVFFSVMMESVVATLLAGLVGIVISILVLRLPPVLGMFGSVPRDVPPYPVEAAVAGLVAAGIAGAVAGLLPALVAVRVKVIDAIRY